MENICSYMYYSFKVNLNSLVPFNFSGILSVILSHSFFCIFSCFTLAQNSLCYFSSFPNRTPICYSSSFYCSPTSCPSNDSLLFSWFLYLIHSMYSHLNILGKDLMIIRVHVTCLPNMYYHFQCDVFYSLACNVNDSIFNQIVLHCSLCNKYYFRISVEY